MILLTVACLFVEAFAQTSSFGELTVHEVVKAPEVSLCSPCISFTEQGLNILVNEIANAGIVGGCSKLCSGLKTKPAVTGCNIVCDVVGVRGFLKALNQTDLDPFYFCELIKACPKGQPDANAKIIQVQSTPLAGPSGTKFSLEVDFSVLNATGVGEINLAVKGPVNTPVAQSFPVMGYAAGNFGAKISLDTTDQDPSDSNPAGLTWNPGMYVYTFELCQGVRAVWTAGIGGNTVKHAADTSR